MGSQPSPPAPLGGTQQPRSHASLPPTPSKAQVVLAAGLQALGSPGAGGSLCYPSPPEECRKGLSQPPWPSVGHSPEGWQLQQPPQLGRGHTHTRQGPAGSAGMGCQHPRGQVHRNENPSRAAGLDPGAQLSSWWGKARGQHRRWRGPVCARSSGPNARTTASMTGPCDLP